MLVTLVQKDNEIHVRVSTGPEGESIMDLHGAQDLDITDLLTKIHELSAHGIKVWLHLLRTRSEADSIEDAKALGILHSFVTMTFPGQVVPTASKASQAETTTKPEASAKPETPAPKPKAKDKPKKHWSRCAYCGEEEELLPVPGFMICKTCAQIELGCMRERRAKDKEKGIAPKE